MRLQHLLHEVKCAKARCLGTQDAAAPFQALARQSGCMELRGELLVHAKEVANLPAANADVTCGNIHVRPNILEQLRHECLAETHYLGIALAARREVAAALAATHWQSGERILEGLFEAKKLQDA